MAKKSPAKVVRISRPIARICDDEAIPAEHSEIALANLFTRFYIEMRYVAIWGSWWIWRGGVWVKDEKLEVFDRARTIVTKASAALDEDEKASAAERIATAKTCAAVVSLARGDERHAASVDQWDRDNWILNTPGGIVDLHTGEMGPHRQLLYCTKMTAVTPAPSVPADCLWLKFLDKICDSNSELVSYLQRSCGYYLTGSTEEEVFFFGFGRGANGKSKFVEAIAGAFGSYHATASMDTFVATKFERHPTDVAALRGARLVTAVETDEGRRWDEAKIKAMTGGDSIRARFMRQDSFEFRPTFKLLVIGNHKPGLRNVDEAMRRRLHVVPFEVTIPVEERDKALANKLRAEWPIVLRWCIEGCLEWRAEGLKPPAIVTSATDRYLSEEDTIGLWLEEQCLVAEKSWCSFAQIWSSWKAWAERGGERPGSKKRLAQALQDRGFKQERTKNGRNYIGLEALVGEADSRG